MGTDLAIVRSLLMQVLLAGYQWQVIFMNSLSSLIGFRTLKPFASFIVRYSIVNSSTQSGTFSSLFGNKTTPLHAEKNHFCFVLGYFSFSYYLYYLFLTKPRFHLAPYLMGFFYSPYSVQHTRRSHGNDCDKTCRVHFLVNLANLFFVFIRHFLHYLHYSKTRTLPRLFLTRRAIVHYTLVLNF